MNYFKLLFIFLFLVSCKKETNYLNISRDVEYVGMNQCAACHQNQYETFINTGMGKSIRTAIENNSDAIFSHPLYDKKLDFFYRPHWFNDSLVIDEYQLLDDDTVHFLNHHVDFIVGSGHHTNSHLFENNSYLYQIPVTYYTQDSILDFPPGFEDDRNTRFSRKMGLECVACHNAYPDFVLGSENKYNHLPLGIDCERCHGPGELHVEKIKNQNLTDTSKSIDYTIVNPANLSIELQNDLCARCHLQGNSVLKENKSFFDFLPGMYLSEIMDIYLPRYSNSDNDFIMASHVDRMKLSKCFINSNENLSCVSCHNPHISVKQSSPDLFKSHCFNCHKENDCQETTIEKQKMNNDCITCHMSKSTTIDIPHVKITDHKIQIIRSSSLITESSEKEFLGLECINNDNPTSVSLVQAYLQQYERFEPYSFYLDSAQIYLKSLGLDNGEGIYSHIYYSFLREEYEDLIEKVYFIGLDSLLSNILIHKDYSNKDAWTCYRIGEAFMKKNNVELAFLFYQQSVKLAPYNLEFRNKYGVSLFLQKNFSFAIDEFQFILNEDNNFVSAYTNLGYIYFQLGDLSEALKNYNYALKLDPYHEKTLINKAEFLLFDNKPKDAFICVQKLLDLNPNNEKALILLKNFE